MRRKDRQLTEISDILNVAKQCKICRLAMMDEQGLYLVPMNFGYTYEQGMLQLYFHSAAEGRKIDALKKTPRVCFEMDCDAAVYAKDEHNPCTYSCRFLSIIGNGMVEFILDHEKKAQALNTIMQHQTGRSFSFSEEMTKCVAVFKVTSSDFCAKRHE